MSPEQVRGRGVDARSRHLLARCSASTSCSRRDRPFDANDFSRGARPDRDATARNRSPPVARSLRSSRRCRREGAGEGRSQPLRRRRRRCAARSPTRARRSRSVGLATDLPPAQPTGRETSVARLRGRPSVLGATALAPADCGFCGFEPATERVGPTPPLTWAARPPARPASARRAVDVGSRWCGSSGVARRRRRRRDVVRFAGGVPPARVGGGQEQASTVAGACSSPTRMKTARGDVADGERAAERAGGGAETEPRQPCRGADDHFSRPASAPSDRRGSNRGAAQRSLAATSAAASQALGRVMALAPRHPRWWRRLRPPQSSTSALGRATRGCWPMRRAERAEERADRAPRPTRSAAAPRRCVLPRRGLRERRAAVPRVARIAFESGRDRLAEDARGSSHVLASGPAGRH